MLKFQVELGMNVENLHNVIFLKQKPALKPDIDFNTNEKTTAKNGFIQICLNL